MMDRNIGVQLYTLRDYCQTEKDFAETMEKVAKIGYKTIQVSCVGPLSPEFMRKEADANGLQVVCTHRPLSEFLDNPKELIRFHQVLGTNIAGVGCLRGSYEETPEGMAELLKILAPIVAELKANGMAFGYHNHACEFKYMGDKWMMDYLIEETDPEGFVFIPDVYWMAYAGVNPIEYLKKMGKRAKVVHFKDLMVTDFSTITYTEVGEGNLNWESIIKTCDEIGAECAVVEQDKCPGNPFDSLQISYHNLKKLGFN
ncbi:MAG: sugar phosphate isomerase/epimerase [Clostridia bacterium]|nr:sugar phosphate isomerase/epimerase [Clostridia bacterium]